MLKRIICIGVLLLMVIAMVSCAPKAKGDFYSLEEAYEQGLLTLDDLKSIAYYLNGESEDESYEPMPKTPEFLSEKTENAIKETRAYNLRNQSPRPKKKAKADEVTIRKYYGTYNNCVAVMIEDAYNAYFMVEREITIEGVLFHYNDSRIIEIWKEK